MSVLKRVVNILVMLYVLLALLFIFSPATRDTFASALGLTTNNTFNASQSFSNLATFYNTLFITGLVLLVLELLVENLYSVALQRDVTRQESKINELKAKLYDYQITQRDRDFQQRGTTTAPAAPTTSHPAPGADNRPIL